MNDKLFEKIVVEGGILFRNYRKLCENKTILFFIVFILLFLLVCSLSNKKSEMYNINSKECENKEETFYFGACVIKWHKARTKNIVYNVFFFVDQDEKLMWVLLKAQRYLKDYILGYFLSYQLISYLNRKLAWTSNNMMMKKCVELRLDVLSYLVLYGHFPTNA